MKKLTLLLCLLGLFGTARADGLWVPPKGTLHSSFSLTGAMWDQFLQQGTSSIPLPGEITQLEISGYAEYVPIENFSIDLHAPIVISQKKFVYLTTDNNYEIVGVQTGPEGEIRDVATNAGIGDVTLGTKYIFWDRGASVGARFHLKVPGSYDYGSLPNSPGDGQTDIGLALLAGVHVPSIRSYLRGSIGYVARFKEPGNQLELMIEPGVNITNRVGARFIYQHTHQYGGTDIVYYGYENYFPENQENSHRIGLGLSYQASDTFSIFALYQQTIAGRNTANTRALTLGVDFSL